MATYKTPGVYVEEISTLPPSVAEVSTAIPAFLGYTEKGLEKGPKIARINTLLEYENLFGMAKPSSFTVNTRVDPDTNQKVVEGVNRSNNSSTTPEFLMYYCVSLYFKNGGGSCYIVPIGNYNDKNKKADKKPVKKDFEDGLALLEKEDEPTLILLTDAINLKSDDYYDLCGQALAQCNKLGDRFAILDVLAGDIENKEKKVKEFREKIKPDYLMYGAAYLPYLQTTLNYQYLETDVQIEEGQVTAASSGGSSSNSTNSNEESTTPPSGETQGNPGITLASIKPTQTALYNQIKTALTAERVVLPPSAAMAGVYARVDRERGVWKAPANVSLSAVIGPVFKITHEEQEGLNIDPTAGKSINAIREFTGKGTLVWGARTLAGNDNEWRYVSVRRLFNMIEESTKKATSFAVFEPNDATTWLKVKGMIESYLYGLWEQGALAGPTAEAAYFVNVGLGKTMTAQDVLEGRMIVEIGVAALRPAEFIIIRFTHKMQEA